MRGRRSAEPQRTYASPKITQEDPLGGGAPRRGMFGGRARGILRREDGDPGTLANYFLFGLGGVNDMRANARADAALETQTWDRNRQVKREDEQQRMLDEAISQLPPDQQLRARLNPESLFTQTDRYGDLERIDGRLGQRNQITGQYDWAPQIPAGMIPQAPTGYRFTPDNNLEAIRGGPADLRVTEQGRRRESALQDSEDNLQNVLGAIAQAENIVNGSGARDLNPFNDTTGFMGRTMRDVPGSAAHDLQQALEPIKANLGFEALAEMRRNSETGGALGQVAVREIELLQRIVRSLEQSQSRTQFTQNLAATRQQVERTMRAVQAAREEMAGASPTNDGTGSPSQRVLRWNPETGQFD